MTWWPFRKKPAPKPTLDEIVARTANSWEIRRYRMNRATQIARRSPERKARFAKVMEGLRI